MIRYGLLAGVLGLALTATAGAREAKLLRAPHYHDGRVAFSYIGDIWTAREDGTDIVRLTANKGRDLTPRFSPDGRWIAFSSDRDGGLDVYRIPAAGGAVKRLTVHSADDVVLGWTRDSRSVLFSSQRGEGWMTRLYTVSVDGGMAQSAGPDMGLAGSYSPDGTRLAVNRKAQAYWRKFYRGAYQSDVTVMDLATRTFKDLTDFPGIDSWPMWSQDGFIYFVSERDESAQANLWRIPESGGNAERVTDFTSGDVRFPAMSADGKTIVFERDFGIAKLDVGTKKVEPLRFDITAETQEGLTELREFHSNLDDYDLAPDGKRIAFAVHGELFTAPTDEGGELRQLTDGPARDQNVLYSPDGKWVTYVSDQTGREEIYIIAADGSQPAEVVTDLDALKSSFVWSPDSKTIAFTTSDNKLYTVSLESKDLKELAASKYGRILRPAWSPDGSWIAVAQLDVTRSSDVYLIPAAGGEAKKVSFDSADEVNPQFSADAKKLYFIRDESEGGPGPRDRTQLFCVPLERLDKDPDEPETTSDDEAEGPGPGGGPPRGRGERNAPPTEPKIDWSGLKRRTRAVTPPTLRISTYLPARDGRTIVFAASEGTGGGRGPGGGGGGGGQSLYTIQDDGKRMTRVTTSASTPSDSEDDDDRGPRRSFGGRISNLTLPKQGRTLYYQDGDSVYSATIAAGGGGSGGGGPGGFRGGRGGGTPDSSGSTGPGGGGGGARRRVSFDVTVTIDKPKEWAEMFDDAWGTMKHRFYDPNMHGKDWDAARAKYKPLVAYVANRQELMNLINEMIGELNASHTGASAAAATRGENGSWTTRQLGLVLEPDPDAGRYKVAHVYEGGPADKDWIKVEPGNYLLALDGKPLKVGDDYHDRLAHRLNRKVELTLNAKPEEAGSWKVKYAPISQGAYEALRYEHWVKERRALVEKLSDGRIGYVHIKEMNQPSLARFRKELAEFRHKEGLVIDERWNGGGNIEQELLAVLVQRPYQLWQPRGTEATNRPFTGYSGVKVVLQNWRSSSNAEMFPAGFRALGLGKVVGTPTMGAVIGTGSYELIDGSTIRTPAVGVYLADPARTNLENHGIQPDVYVENSPEDNLAGRDRQLEVAVKEVLKGLKSSEGVAGRE